MSFTDAIQGSKLVLKDREEDRLPEVKFQSLRPEKFPKITSTDKQISNLKKRISKLILPALDLNKEQLLRERNVQFKRNTNLKRICLKTVDNISLDAVQLLHDDQKKLPKEEQKWLLFLNGNASAYEHNIENLIKIANDLKVNVLSGNYRGVGASQGFPINANDLVIDGETMLNYILEHKGVKPNHVFIHGWSMGAAVALKVCSRYQEPKNEIGLCYDRSFSKIENVVTQSLSCSNLWSLAVSKFFSASGWSFGNLKKKYESIKGYKFYIYHPYDDVIKQDASMHFALGENRGPRIILFNRGLYIKAEKETVQEKLEKTLRIVHYPSPNGQYLHSISIYKTSEKDYKSYLKLVKKALNLS